MPQGCQLVGAVRPFHDGDGGLAAGGDGRGAGQGVQPGPGSDHGTDRGALGKETVHTGVVRRGTARGKRGGGVRVTVGVGVGGRVRGVA